MKPLRYSHRPYQAGDAAAINELYFQITGRRRTLQQHAWQWLESPAGPSEIWLIEAEMADGSRRLIGHHGVMAETFTYRGQPVRVGKTENTMVLPEYREKLLYPRYEKLFLGDYEGRFHALFSTTGPAPAIRLRQAMGYEARQRWVSFYVGTEPFLSIGLVRERLARSPRDLRARIRAASGAKMGGARVTCLDGAERGFDFDGFWQQVSPRYGLTPARTRANLQWRFWSNPYVLHHSVSLDDPNQGMAIAILSVRQGHVLHVDDLYCERPERLGHFMGLLSRWATKHLGVGAMASETTTDGLGYLRTCGLRTVSWAHRMPGRTDTLQDRFMPRKVTPLGRTVGIDPVEAWYVTPFYFEGT